MVGNCFGSRERGPKTSLLFLFAQKECRKAFAESTQKNFLPHRLILVRFLLFRGDFCILFSRRHRWRGRAFITLVVLIQIGTVVAIIVAARVITMTVLTTLEMRLGKWKHHDSRPRGLNRMLFGEQDGRGKTKRIWEIFWTHREQCK